MLKICTAMSALCLIFSGLHAQSSSNASSEGRYSELPMDQFIGTNSFIDTPLEKLAPVGWIREYHPWSFNEIENDVFEYNRWDGYWDFDKFYTDLKELVTMVCPVVWSSPSWLQDNGNYRPVVNEEDPFVPNSYREIAEMMYQFVGRYGANKVDENTLFVNDGQVKKTGLNLITYYEDWNEQDKDWEGEKGEFQPGHYAAMASANADGHCGTMGPYYGMKQADPDAKFVMGGLADLDTSYLNGMKTWFEHNRPDSTWPIDVINVHHYAFFQYGTGISPEADNFKAKIADIVGWKNRNVPENEVWVTEFGYDSNPVSMNRAPEIGSYSQEEVQAMWNLRTFLLLSSTGIERAAHYMIRDTDPGSEPRYGDSGLTTSPKEGHEPKVTWYYLLTMRSILKDFYFKEIIREDQDACIYKYDKGSGDTAVYACWRPSNNGWIREMSFKTDILADTLKITRMLDKSVEGNMEYVRYDTAGISISISECPLFIEVIKDTTAFTSDTTSGNTDTTGIFVHHYESACKVFPNPASDILNISFTDLNTIGRDITIELTDITGRLLTTHHHYFPGENLETTLDISTFSNGLYLLRLSSHSFRHSEVIAIRRG
ncbi:T9SS type A sorting domain-containing protein [Bacteroidota bacterium]